MPVWSGSVSAGVLIVRKGTRITDKVRKLGVDPGPKVVGQLPQSDEPVGVVDLASVEKFRDVLQRFLSHETVTLVGGRNPAKMES